MISLHAGSKRDISVQDNKIELTPVEEELTLEDLLVESSKECFAITDEDSGWLNAKGIDLMYAPDKGYIVSLDFAGKEIVKCRPEFVIYRKMCNEHIGFAIVAPITSTERGMNLEVILSEDLSTQGVILIHQVKSLDFSNHQVKFIEQAPQAITDKAADLTKVIIL